MPITKTDKKVDGKQQYRVRVNYTDLFGNHRQVERTAYGAAEAKTVEAQLLREYNSNVSKNHITVSELINKYLDAKRHDVRATTLEKSSRNLSRYILPSLGDKQIDKLSVDTLQKWKNHIGTIDIGIHTKQNIYKEFSALLNYAVKVGYLPQNPLARVGNFKDSDYTAPRDKLRYYTPEQFQKYISVAVREARTQSDWNYFTFFAIAYYTGMRKGEINALKWSDIEGNTIHVRRSVAQKVKGQSIIETSPKNKSSYRTIQMPSPLIEILREQRNRQMQISDYSEEFRVCGGQKCLSDTGIENHNKHYADEAGLPHIRIHDFRHSHASLLANEGINIQEIARRLGHSRVEQTWNTYSHLYPREEERALSVLNKVEIPEQSPNFQKK